ncbi:MAG: PH domain-containing protein, partial [Planctomycetes bacterium]|nr:PH domain-containing protein [Planctomycetota bacterium]
FPRAALARGRRRAVRWATVFALALIAAWLWAGALPGQALLVIPVFYIWLWLIAGWSYRRRAFAVAGQCLILREGWWKIRTTYVLMEKVQSVNLAAGVFDRRWGHAHLSVDTAGGGSTGHSFALHWLASDTARALQEDIVARAARARFYWS